jgi:hypothetical protein
MLPKYWADAANEVDASAKILAQVAELILNFIFLYILIG